MLIIGETGTGKELFAQSILLKVSVHMHHLFRKTVSSFTRYIRVHIPFGTVRGAFTGAVDSPGLFEQANGGTLLLDELNSLNVHTAGKIATRFTGEKSAPYRSVKRSSN